MKFTVELPVAFKGELSDLSPQEVAELRAILTSPVWLKLDAIIQTAKPSPHAANMGSTSRDEFSNDRANAKLGEMRGWELFRAAIYSSIMPRKERRAPAKENYQSADADEISKEMTLPGE